MPSTTSVRMNSRIGKIRDAVFPVYVAREANGAGTCGHQHRTVAAARNCATGIVQRTRREWGVFKCNTDGSSSRVVLLRYVRPEDELPPAA